MINFWIFFLKNRAFTFLIIGSLIAVGLYSIILIPKESSPEVIIPIGIVSTVLRGGSAEDVEKLITNKLESEVINIENIDKVTSNSSEGVSVISAQFLASADVDKSIADLKDAIDRVKRELPTDAEDPIVSKVNFADEPVLIFSVSADLPPKDLTKLGEDLSKEIKKVKGVSDIDVAGTRKREVQVVIAKDKIASFGISIGQVVGAIASANASAPIGNITMSDINYPIKFDGSIEQGIEVPDITLQGKGGIPIYLRDIAYIVDGLEDPKTYSRVSVDGEPSQNALTLSVKKKSGGDVTAVTNAVLAKIDELKKPEKLLDGAEVVVSVNRGADVNKDLTDLSRTAVETVILVMIILFLTIGWRESIVAGLSIPLSFVIAFIGLLISGNTINFLSLFSLILAIGILVDSGIVVAEAIHTRVKKYPGDDTVVEKGAIESIKEYAWPLIAGTMTTVAVFFPLFFLSGIVGQFVKSIPFTIIFVLIASIFVALGMVPIIATLISKSKKSPQPPLGKGGQVQNNIKTFSDYQEEYFHISQDWYKRFLGNILLSRKTQNWFFAGLAAAFVLVVIVLPVMGGLKVELFPQDDQPFVIVSIEKPAGTVLSSTDILTRQVEEILYSEKDVGSFVTTIGASSALTGEGGGSDTKVANITVMLNKERDKDSTTIANELRNKLSVINDGIVKVGQGNNGPPGGFPVVIKFTGTDLNELTDAANVAEKILLDIEGTQDVTTSVKNDGTQLELIVDRAKASQNGLSASDIAQILRISVSGVTATTIKKDGEDTDVLVKVALNENFVNPEDTIKTTLDSLKNLPIATANGSILLGSIMDVKVSPSRASIAHENEKRITSASSNLKSGVDTLSVTTKFQEKIKTAGISPNVTIDYGGENEDINNTFRDMILALISGLVLMLAILVLTFNSFRYSFYLLMTIPLSLIGVIGGLAIAGKALSFSAMLGIIALAGVIINHAIILLDSMLHRLELEKNSLTPDPSPSERGEVQRLEGRLFNIIVESSAIRLRPIFLTTVTTVVGMIPLAGVSELWGPLAFTIMFGLTFAMILTLVLVPVFFYRYPGKKYAMMK